MHFGPRTFLAVACAVLLAACSSKPSTSGPGPDGGSGGQAGSTGTGGAGHGSDPPLPKPPSVPAKACTIDLAKFQIANDGTNPDGTTDGINKAVTALVAEGCGHVKLPAGQYAIGKTDSDSYTSGVVLPSGVSFELDDAAVLQLRPTATWAYCVIAISAVHDVQVSGGAIVGDRDQHDFTMDGEEGHCICVEDESERVAIDHVKLSKAIGDGVLIVAQGADGSSCKDVSITNSELHDNRRQGVSVVGGVRVLIEKNEIHHIDGTAPEFGVDIESLSYDSHDITIRGNQFHHNHGGDVVNTDGRGVLVEGNTMTDGDGSQYIDGPLIYWSNTDQTLRGNQITMALGSANGKMGILEYSHMTPRTNMTRTVIEGNTLEDCSIDLMNDTLVTIRKNTVHGSSAAYILYQVGGVELVDNVLEKDGTSYSYMIYESMGTASGNILNGAPYDLAMTPDQPFSNWDGQ